MVHFLIRKWYTFKLVYTQKGQVVRIIDGKFKGVVGRVARYQGQQRVGIVIDGLLTVATAYIPTAFLEIQKATFCCSGT